MIIQINKEGEEKEHEIKVIDELRKTGIKHIDSKDVEKQIENVNIKVGMKNKDNDKLPFGEDKKKDEEDKKGDENEEDKKEETKKELKIDTQARGVQEVAEKRPHSAQVSLKKGELETEKRDKRDKTPIHIKELNIIDEDNEEESLDDNHRKEEKDERDKEEEELENEADEVELERIKKTISMRVRKHEVNKLNMNLVASSSLSSENDSPVKQDFLPISSKNVVVQKLVNEDDPSKSSSSNLQKHFITPSKSKDLIFRECRV
jgi:hypothetical protein